MRFRIILLLSLFLLPALAMSQSSDEKLAAQYFENKEFDKALPIYQDLTDERPQDFFYYDRYLSCLIETKALEKAEKFVRKRLRKFDENVQYAVDLGYILEKAEKPKEAEKQYESVVANLKTDYGAYIRAANGFQKRLKYDWAIKTYEKGEKEFEGSSDFSSQLALLYLETGNREKGLEKYVGIVINSGLPFEQSQHLFEMNVTDSADFAVLRIILVRQIQKMPDNNSLYELLKWTFIKQKDWASAYIQTRSLDKRLKEQGFRMIELGELCMTNEAWETAARCFEYIKEIGTSGMYYHQGVSGLLETRYNQMVMAGNVSKEGLATLQKEFSDFITEMGYSDASWRSVSRLGDLYMLYSHETAKAITLLEDFRMAPGVSKRTQALAKLQLGDAYVIDGDVWSSELLFAQVEKDYQEDPIGQEAKFRRARLSYYRGDFDWAKIQLEVLKGATTQLISNNAIELALSISENLGVDSNYVALEMYAHAELLRVQNLLDDSEKLLDSIPKLFPGHSLSDDILFARAQIREKQGRYEEAADLYETLAIAFSHDILTDNAWFYLGMLYENKLNDKTKALEAFKKIVLDFPGSLYQVEARKHYRRLRGDSV